jgi:hypothetical protein
MRRLHFVFGPLGVLVVILGSFVSISAQTHKKGPSSAAKQTPSAKQDPAAKEAFLALEKVESIVESGVGQADYTRALADANFPLKMYLDSDSAVTFPDLTNALRDSMKWYRAAGSIWHRKILTDFPIGYCDKWTHALPHNAVLNDGPYLSEDLCSSYPELVTTYADSRHYDATDNTITEDRKIIDYDKAQQQAWKLADAELQKAELVMK